MLLFLVAAAVLVTTAALVAASLNLDGVSFVIGAYLLGWAELVGLTEALSLVDSIGRTGYAAGECVLLAAAAAVWIARRRPRPRLRFPVRALLRDPTVVAIALVVLGGLAYEFFLLVATPPNSYDGLSYHLARAVAWLQQGHIGYFSSTTARANAFPPNAEIGILYTLAFLGRDTLAALPQYVAKLAVLASVYGMSRRYTLSSNGAAVFAALGPALGDHQPEDGRPAALRLA
jgi:hypothetical protein